MSIAELLFPSARQELYNRFEDKLEIAHVLNRRIVSFQANKKEPITRWFKYKEGFASSLVKYFLTEYSTNPGRLLDPFAGAGTALFAGKELGWQPFGIELLPVGALAIRAREALSTADPINFAEGINKVKNQLRFIRTDKTYFKHVAITRDAFPTDTEESLNAYLEYCINIKDEKLSTFLYFIGFTILEEISFTRKDGQYLRWDHRSKRALSGKFFDKGRIFSFEEALINKLAQVEDDFLLPSSPLPFDWDFPPLQNQHTVRLRTGSCLEQLPQYDDNYFDFVITSPPYCNRYDYTRTYALELVYLGCDDGDIRRLRQEMLSCTVENKEKLAYLEGVYDSNERSFEFARVLKVYEGCEAMSEVNLMLDRLKNDEQLNNKNIARMVKNYFLEMCFVVFELARVTRSGGFCVMVNDNVRYGGEEVPVDLILSEFAEQFGFIVEKIFVLPRGKGNSSQQMGAFGRTETRKCVYLWRKS